MSMLGKAQNFTETEAELIAQLRELLPQVVEDAGKLSSEPVGSAIWGVPLLPVSSDKERDLRVDVILHKFLKARNGDIVLARQMLTNTLKWRAEFKIGGILDEEFPEDVFGKVGYIYGTDGEGRPVTYNFYGSLDNKQVFGDLERFLRWRVQLHERGMQGLDFVNVADMIQVHDYDGVSVFGYDKVARAASKATVQLMSDNYPETLATKIFANVPGWGETVFNVICRWLSDDTKRKFVVVSKASAPRVLAERIGEANLPDKFRPGAVEQPKEASTAAAEPKPLVAEPAPPMAAHSDHNEGGPRPTSRGSQQSGSGSSDIDSQDVDEISPPPPPPPLPVATAAPKLGPQPETLASETAGLRLSDNATVDTQEHGDKHGTQI
ncbi:Non-classical phosphatidylinositol transfer protein (PITP) [Coemansia sp. RSA 2050]|nr:Non-classical phosphatidylinositol transfer protein (PITP) [Coemansia sp. RSA 2050]KAJ2731731.1 Non-classical phosphatidylinositol transfer protein (PITP) [Coemansia sp. BCRC 34962]